MRLVLRYPLWVLAFNEIMEINKKNDGKTLGKLGHTVRGMPFVLPVFVIHENGILFLHNSWILVPFCSNILIGSLRMPLTSSWIMDMYLPFSPKNRWSCSWKIQMSNYSTIPSIIRPKVNLYHSLRRRPSTTFLLETFFVGSITGSIAGSRIVALTVSHLSTHTHTQQCPSPLSPRIVRTWPVVTYTHCIFGNISILWMHCPKTMTRRHHSIIHSDWIQ